MCTVEYHVHCVKKTGGVWKGSQWGVSSLDNEGSCKQENIDPW